MKLSELIQKKIATATVATIATVGATLPSSVATEASVAVATEGSIRTSPENSKLQILFPKLYVFLVSLDGWNEFDHEAWQSDYENDPHLTINCLLALQKSWDAGRYGVMIPDDWPVAQEKTPNELLDIR